MSESTRLLIVIPFPLVSRSPLGPVSNISGSAMIYATFVALQVIWKISPASAVPWVLMETLKVDGGTARTENQEKHS